MLGKGESFFGGRDATISRKLQCGEKHCFFKKPGFSEKTLAFLSNPKKRRWMVYKVLKQANAYVFGLYIADACVFASKRWEKQCKRVCVWCMDSKRVCVWHLKQKMLQNSILRHSSAQVFV